jgi:hypothetical protein
MNLEQVPNPFDSGRISPSNAKLHIFSLQSIHFFLLTNGGAVKFSLMLNQSINQSINQAIKINQSHQIIRQPINFSNNQSINYQ